MDVTLLIIGKKEYDKISKMVQRQQNVSEHVSPFYIQMLLNLDTTVQNVLSDKDAKKKLNATKAKALTAMKQKTKKALKEHETEVARFKSVSCISMFSESVLYTTPPRIRRLSRETFGPPLHPQPLSKLLRLPQPMPQADKRKKISRP